MTHATQDHLYSLLPYVYRYRDAGSGAPLRSFLGVIASIHDVLEADLDRLYDNWFIETCEEWVVPYIGELVGYKTVAQSGEPGAAQATEGMLLRRTLAPRSDVARTVAQRRLKGTLALLEELTRTASGWPAHATESYRRLSYTQPINHQRPERGRTVDLCSSERLRNLQGAFDDFAHTIDLRRPVSTHGRGRYGAGVGVFVWRLRSWPVTYCQAYLNENTGRGGRGCFTFDVLGKHAQLFTHPEAEPDPYTLSEVKHVPAPITRAMLERDLIDHNRRTHVVMRRSRSQYYGEGRSFFIWLDRGKGLVPIGVDHILAADLHDWRYEAPEDMVLVDPERGRFKVAGDVRAARVTWYQGFSAAIGGGEYDRDLPEPREPHQCYFVDDSEPAKPGRYASLADALDAWRRDKTDAEGRRSIIEVAARGVQAGPATIALAEDETLILRAADRNRPVLRLLDDRPDGEDTASVLGARGSRFVLDGFLVAGRGVKVSGDLAEVVVRHCTLVPPLQAGEPQEGGTSASLAFVDFSGDVRIERSIVGPVTVTGRGEPARVDIVGSIIDAGHDDDDAVCDGASSFARATLTLRESTIYGRVTAHAVALAQNCIFSGIVRVARRQPGCVRFCYIPGGSRTPRRYHCQPDLVLAEARGGSPALMDVEEDRVRPVWTSRVYGHSAYGQLWRGCAREISRGAHDQGEMGVLHDLFLPQREDALSTRLAEYVPAGVGAGIFFVT